MPSDRRGTATAVAAVVSATAAKVSTLRMAGAPGDLGAFQHANSELVLMAVRFNRRFRAKRESRVAAIVKIFASGSQVPRGLARRVAGADSGSSGQGCRG